MAEDLSVEDIQVRNRSSSTQFQPSQLDSSKFISIQAQISIARLKTENQDKFLDEIIGLPGQDEHTPSVQMQFQSQVWKALIDDESNAELEEPSWNDYSQSIIL